MLNRPPSSAVPDLSVVIPVFNGSRTIAQLVERTHRVFSHLKLEMVLVDDGSSDESEQVCACLAQQYPDSVIFVQLGRNFGEHNAVLAGLSHSSGQYISVLDDDGQNPPEEVARMLAELKIKNLDVVYGHYIEKQHSWFRNFGSRFNDRMATMMLSKPPELYLSSFKVMNRFVVNEIIKYRGAFPYIDGLIYRTTRHIGQIKVEHRQEIVGGSRYTLRKLVRLWLNMFLNFSIAPLRASAYLGLLVSSSSLVLMTAVWIHKFLSEDFTIGTRTVLGAVVFFAGFQLMILGLIGEYLGRLYLDHSGTPQYVVRYVKGAAPNATDKQAGL